MLLPLAFSSETYQTDQFLDSEQYESGNVSSYGYTQEGQVDRAITENRSWKACYVLCSIISAWTPLIPNSQIYVLSIPAPNYMHKLRTDLR
jgi:hypothetical protein